jgi:hypothetical protein
MEKKKKILFEKKLKMYQKKHHLSHFPNDGKSVLHQWSIFLRDSNVLA